VKVKFLENEVFFFFLLYFFRTLKDLILLFLVKVRLNWNLGFYKSLLCFADKPFHEIIKLKEFIKFKM